MDIGLIDMCMAGYRDRLAPGDWNRLRFLRGLWETMEQAAAGRDGEGREAHPDSAELQSLYREGVPLFAAAPPAVDERDFAETAGAIAEYLRQSGAYGEEAAQVLAAMEWTRSLPGYAGDAEAACVQEGSSDALAEKLAAAVAALAGYTFYESSAHRLMDALGADEAASRHPLRCPVCGSAPALASVGTKTSTEGRGRKLYCLDCGTEWEFERVRCARCGTRDQTKLHFYSIEGDCDHRLAVCDECGGYIRTSFLDSNLAPFSPWVEDAVMAPLEALGRRGIAEGRLAS